MQSSDLLAAAEALIDHARAEGADAADATAHAGASHGVTVRLGVLEDIDRSESASVALRVFCGSRSASVSTSDLSRAGLAELAIRAVAMARHAPEDPFAGLAPEGALARGPFPDLGIDDGTPRSVYTLDPSEMTQLAGRGTDVEPIELAPGETADLPDGLGSITFENEAPEGAQGYEESVKRYAEESSHEIPQRGVDGRDRHRDEPGAAGVADRADHRLPRRCGVAGVACHDRR